jgi:hypothetical protein
MSEARKCDRCNGYFELSAEDQKNRNYPYDMKGTYVKIMLFGRYGEVENSVRWFDLCPNCVERLDKWLENPDIDDTDCTDRSNGATEKELELASKLNDAKIYIAQLKNELGYTMTKEEIEFMKGIHNFTDEDISEAAKFVETKSSSEDKYKDPCASCHDCHCEQCDYGYISEEEKKKRWVERHKKETKLSDPYEEGGL